MAMLLKKNGRLFCANYNDKEDGDVYISDLEQEVMCGALGEGSIFNYNPST